MLGISLLQAQPLTEKYAARLTMPPMYTCIYTDVPPVIDGIPNEQAWQKARPISQLQDIRGAEMPKPTPPTEIRMLWDDTNLYVSARLEEPFIRATLSNRDDIVWHENDFEVFIDPDGDGINYFELEINALGTLLDLQMSHPYRSGGHFFSAWNCPGLKSAVKVHGTINDSTDRDNYWTVEMAIPHRALSVDFNDALKQSRVWRMNFSRVEWMKDGGPEENWVWAPTGLLDIHMPERWAYVYLMGDPMQPRRSDKPMLNYDITKYQFLWMLYYVQQEHWQQHKTYIGRVEDLGLTDADWKMIMPQSADLSPVISSITARPELNVYATPHSFELILKQGSHTYLLDQRGHFRVEVSQNEGSPYMLK